MSNLRWDSVVKGLHIKTLPSGKQTYALYYRTKTGTQRRPKIGDVGQITLIDARRIAREMLIKVAAGEDPQEKIIAARQAGTVQEMFNHTWATYWNQDRFRNSGWAKEVGYNYFNHVCPRFGAKKLTEITAPEIREWHRSFRDIKPNAGNRSLDVLSRLFSYAEEEGFMPIGSNPCAVVKKHTEGKRQRVATREEIRKVCQILDREERRHPREVAFIYTLMLTGARPRSIERAKKSEIVFHNTHAVLTFDGKSTSKTGMKESIVLPFFVSDKIRKLPEKNSPNIFGIRMPRAFWNKVKTEAGCPDFWIRDWRRTFASYGLSRGISSGAIGELLNHWSAQTTKLYTRLNHDVRIENVEMIAREVLK